MYMFDVLIFLLVLVCLLIYVLLRLCRWMSRACWRMVPVKRKTDFSDNLDFSLNARLDCQSLVVTVSVWHG